MATTSGEPTAAPGALIEVRLTAIRYAARDTNLFEFRRLDGEPLPSPVRMSTCICRAATRAATPWSWLDRTQLPPASNAIRRAAATPAMHDELRVGGTIKISIRATAFAQGGCKPQRSHRRRDRDHTSDAWCSGFWAQAILCALCRSSTRHSCTSCRR
jgi:hypothetical protein